MTIDHTKCRKYVWIYLNCGHRLPCTTTTVAIGKKKGINNFLIKSLFFHQYKQQLRRECGRWGGGRTSEPNKWCRVASLTWRTKHTEWQSKGSWQTRHEPKELWLYLVVSLCRRIPRTTTSSAAVATAADVHNEGELSLSYVNESRTNRHSRNHIFVLDAQKLILCRPIEVQSFLLMAQEKNCFSAIHILFCTFGVFLYTSCTLHLHGCDFAGKRGAASSSPRTN